MTMTATEAVDDLDLWLKVVHAADDAFRRFDPSVREAIERGEGDDEVLRLVPLLSNLSTATRRRLEALILFRQGHEGRPIPLGGVARETRLRIVEEAG